MNKQPIINEQAEIAEWLSHHGGPSIRPDWGALQPLYDRAVARGHRLVRIIASIDQPCSFELDSEPIGNDALIGFAKAALDLDLDAALLKTPSIRPKKRILRSGADKAPEASPVLLVRLSQAELQNVIDVGAGVFERTLRRPDDSGDPEGGRIRAFG